MDTNDTPRKLLMVWHSRTGAAQQMVQAAAHGANDVINELHANQHLQIITLRANQAKTEHLLKADGFLFCAPENLGSLSGAMKEFFDVHYYDVLDQLNGRPAAVLIAAGSDGQGAARQAERICTGWRLRLVAPALIVNTNAQTKQDILAPKQLTEQQRQACAELGGTLAALLC